MTIYLAIYGAFSLLAISKRWKQDQFGIIAICSATFITIFVGYRYYVGVDWITYEIIFLDNARSNLSDALTYGDSAYSFVNWSAARLGGQVWHVNLACAALFSAGLVLFCGKLPRPSLALTVAIPTLIVATAMGYTRQATAIGCIMLAFAQFRGGFDFRWLFWLCLAILFHKSAIFVLPIFVAAASRHKWISIAIGGAISLILLFSVVLQNFQDLLSLYFESDIESTGTLPRMAIGAISGVAFFLTRNKDIFGERKKIIRNMAVAMIFLLALYPIIPSTTVVDRIGILLVPFQSAIWSGFVASFQRSPILETIMTAFVVAIYAVIYVVWLMFSSYAAYWIPYQNVLFVKWL